MPKPKCSTCWGEDFFTDNGFLYCAECQTQSQDIRVEVVDDFFMGQKGTVRTLKKSLPGLDDDSPVAGNKLGLTTWEIFNYVLKGLVDEMIQLGSKSEVKIVALQLWASYLKTLEVAFTSSNISRKPKLSLCFKPKDAEIIYGVSSERVHTESLLRHNRKRRVSVSSGSDTSNCSILSKRASAKKASSAKKALVAAAYDQTLSTVENDSLPQDVNNQTLESIGTPSEHSDTGKSQRIKLTKHAKALLQETRTKLAKIKCKKHKINYRKNVLRKQTTTMNNLSLAKIVALLRLSLLFCRENIHICDILRWIAEGHLSVNKCEKFIPKDVKIPAETHRVLDPSAITHSGQHMTVMNLCVALGISRFPVPDLWSLAQRYCQELQLPDDFVAAVQSWILHTPTSLIKMDANFEARTMAYIVVLLKLVFSLDGVTETKLSELAVQVNRSPLRQGEQRLFVWTDWVEYIECRKAVVASFHHVTRHSVYKHLPGQDMRMFLDHYGHTAYRNVSDYLKTVMDEDWRNAVRKTISQLEDNDTISADIIRFPPTLTPLFTYCRVLTTEHSDRLSDKVKHVLAQEFTGHTMSFLFNPRSSVVLGVNCDLDIELTPGIANSCVVEKFPEAHEIIDNTTINRKNVRVQIVSEARHGVKTEAKKPDQSDKEGDLSDILSDDSSDEEDIEVSTLADDISIGQPSRVEKTPSLLLYETRQTYWICHKKFESNEEFNVFAANMFPCTFLWLLTECARVVGVSDRDLYEDVMFLEKKKNMFVKNSGLLRKRRKHSL